MQAPKKLALSLALSVPFVFGLAIASCAADSIKLGAIKNSNYGPFFIAQERGYFAAENLAADFVFFDAPQAMAPAVVAGAVDVGFINANGAFLNLAGQGALRLIAGGPEEAPGFHDFVVVASNPAYARGLKSLRDLSGSAVAVGTIAGLPAYSLTLIEQRYDLDPKTVRLVQVESIPNIVSTVVGGHADVGLLPTTFFASALSHDDVKLLGYVGDEVRWQIGIIFTSSKLADGNPDLVNRFLRAFRKGTKDYHDAFATADGRRADGAGAAEVLAIISKYLGQPAEQIDRTVSYFDADGRLDERDFLRQVAWYKSLGFVKPEVDGAKIIDKRYVVPLP